MPETTAKATENEIDDHAMSKGMKEVKNNASKEVMGAALGAARDLAVLQVFAKIVSVMSNNILLRVVSPSMFGVVNVQLELIVSTLLFVAREPLRLAALRVSAEISNENKQRRDYTQAVVNSAWLAFLIGVPFAVIIVQTAIRASKSKDESMCA
jgi:oligosaccharide translocation protein RFT1